MAKTSFSGPVHSVEGFENSLHTLGFNGFCTINSMINTNIYVASGLTTDLGHQESIYNTTYKYTGATFIDGSTGIIYHAAGSDADDQWHGSNSSTIQPTP
jgi:hypothetical protein